jgi:hypothetical protein
MYREQTIKIYEKDYKLKSNDFNFKERVTYTTYGYTDTPWMQTLKP